MVNLRICCMGLFTGILVGSVWPGLSRAVEKPLSDGLGRPVVPLKDHGSVASCTLASDEILVTLLQKKGQLRRLVALSTLADAPAMSNVPVELAKQIPARCGGAVEPLLKSRASLIILATYNRPELIRRLEQAGATTFVLANFNALADIEQHILELGHLLGLQAEAQELQQEFRKKRQSLSAPRHRLSVLEFFPDGTVSGGNTLFSDLVWAAGGKNAAASLSGWPKVGPETILKMAPDLMVAAGDDETQVLNQIRATPGWKDLRAAKLGHLLVLPARTLGSASHFALGALTPLAAKLAALPESARQEKRD